MTREELDKKVVEFNNKLGQLEFSADSFDLETPLSQLEQKWQTANSAEVLGNMKKKIGNMVGHVKDMQAAINALKSEKLSVFFISETTRTENAPNPNDKE